MYDITRTLPISPVSQAGGKVKDDDETSETPTSVSSSVPKSSKVKLNDVDALISKVLNNENVSPAELEKLDFSAVTKSGIYKKLSNKKKEFVFNTIQDMLPKDKKEVHKIKPDQEETLSANQAYFICKNCSNTEKIPDGTLIISKSSESLSHDYITNDNYKDMINSNILPITRNYICPNKKCESHTNPELREAVFFRINNTYNIRYVCRTCIATWMP